MRAYPTLRLPAYRTLGEILLLGLVIVLLTRPASPPVFWEASVVRGVSTPRKLVALTFDDGPDPRYTPHVLRTLARYGLHATFFMIGERMEQHPELVRQVLAAGDAIGNHTYSHPLTINQEPEPDVIHELDRCDAVIQRFTGTRTQFFRPPSGVLDSNIYMTAQEEGYRTVLWTVCADHHDAPTPQAMARRVLRAVHPGAIVLEHDGGPIDRAADVKAIPLIVEPLLRRGYRFVTVPELMGVRSPRSMITAAHPRRGTHS